MADKLDWLNQHFVLLLHKTVAEVIANENYKLPFELRQNALTYPQSDAFIYELEKHNELKKASEFLAYNLQHRALAWWGYCCVLSLEQELQEKPAEERKLEDIGKPREFNIPDWAKMPEDNEPELKSVEDVYNIPEIKKIKEELEATRAKAQAEFDKFPQELKDKYYKVKKEVYDQFTKEFGKSPNELLQDLIKLANDNLNKPDIDMEKSPIFKAEKELKEKIEKVRQETIKSIKAAVPQKSEEEKKEQTSNAMDSAYAYIVAPNDLNAQNCLNLGNLCPDLPEGLLSLVCFWSYGNMTPNADNQSAMVIKTPPGLAANGLNSLLLMCALAKGGTRKFDERVKLYFEIGKEIAYGHNVWSVHVANKLATHRDYSDKRFTGLVGDNEAFKGTLSPEETSLESKSFNATNKGNNFNNTPDNVKTQSHNTNNSAATEKKDGEKERKGTTTFTRFKG